MTNRTYSTTNQSKPSNLEQLLQMFGRYVRLEAAIEARKTGTTPEGTELGAVYGFITWSPALKLDVLAVTKGPHKGSWLALRKGAPQLQGRVLVGPSAGNLAVRTR